MNDKTEQVSGDGVVKSADRVLDLFELLAGWGREMSHTEIAQALDIPKGSLSKLLKNLVARGYVDYQPASKGYCLGESLKRLVGKAHHKQNLKSLAEPLLREITALTNESCALNYRNGNEVEVVATVTSPQRLLSHLRTGDTAPLYAVSGGKIILAKLPAELRDEYLQSVEIEAFTPHTLQDIAQLRAQLEEARETGIAFSLEELTPGIVGIAVAICSESGHPIAALNVAIPAVRYNDASRRQVIEVLQRAAAKLSRQYANQA
jgi:DNA-binding IclR family transcriptional regulator